MRSLPHEFAPYLLKLLSLTGAGTSIAGVSGSFVWSWLRQARSDPPGRLIADQDRLSVFRSALQQFEDLMFAAEGTGFAGRPLPLFYALSQGGRAILAARGGTQPDRHGLVLRDVESRLLESVVRPDRRGGAFRLLCETLMSPQLTEGAELGALFCSLPELANPGYPVPEGWPLPALIWPEATESWGQPVTQVRTAVVLDDQPQTADEVRRCLARYPLSTRVRWEIAGESMGLPHLMKSVTPAGYGVVIDWHVSTLDEVAPEHRWFDRRWLSPSVEPTVRLAPIPLMVWWSLLFGLSILARYHPVEWVQALDVDRSPLAVPLRRAMEEAITALPHLLLEALTGQHMLVHPPDGI